jgi:hypothetical protein
MSKLMRTVTTGIVTLGVAAMVQVPAHADGRIDEGRFLQVVGTMSSYVRPYGDSTTNAQLLAFGYRACAKLDRHPTDLGAATRALYHQVNPSWEQAQVVFYAGEYLCNRHWHAWS